MFNPFRRVPDTTPLLGECEAAPDTDGSASANADSALLRRYVETGSERAFAAVVNRHAGWVYSTCRRSLRDDHLAEDATQAVFLLLARKASSLKSQTHLGGWLFQACRYVLADVRKNRARYERRQDVAKELAVQRLNGAAGEQSDADPQLSSVLDEALAGLGDADRQAILMHFYEGRSVPEMAARLQINEEAAKKRLHRALSRLRQRVPAADGKQVLPVALVALVLRGRSAEAAVQGDLLAEVARGAVTPGASSPVAESIARSVGREMVRATNRLLASLAVVATEVVLLFVVGGSALRSGSGISSGVVAGGPSSDTVAQTETNNTTPPVAVESMEVSTADTVEVTAHAREAVAAVPAGPYVPYQRVELSPDPKVDEEPPPSTGGGGSAGAAAPVPQSHGTQEQRPSEQSSVAVATRQLVMNEPTSVATTAQPLKLTTRSTPKLAIGSVSGGTRPEGPEKPIRERPQRDEDEKQAPMERPQPAKSDRPPDKSPPDIVPPGKTETPPKERPNRPPSGRPQNGKPDRSPTVPVVNPAPRPDRSPAQQPDRPLLNRLHAPSAQRMDRDGPPQTPRHDGRPEPQREWGTHDAARPKHVERRDAGLQLLSMDRRPGRHDGLANGNLDLRHTVFDRDHERSRSDEMNAPNPAHPRKRALVLDARDKGFVALMHLGEEGVEWAPAARIVAGDDGPPPPSLLGSQQIGPDDSFFEVREQLTISTTPHFAAMSLKAVTVPEPGLVGTLIAVSAVILRRRPRG